MLMAMRIGLLETPHASLLRSRLKALSVLVFDLEPSQVQELTGESADLVYMIPWDGMSGRNWGLLRVNLARSCRKFIVGGADLRSADIMAAVRDGAFDVVDERDEDDRWFGALAQAAEAQRLWIQLYGGSAASSSEVLSGQSVAMRALRQAVAKLGPTDVNVLILGESGAGKERVARALHEASRRKNLVALNCAAIPKDLLEAELFGVEKGAFTGALKSRAGLVEQAAGGTLFLDEIGEMDLGLQPKLLRFLETRSARRVGSEKEYSSKVRVIAATNRDLRAEANSSRFRSDLYFRLAEVTLTVPPLRERPEDIPELIQIFLRLANERFGKNVEGAEPALVQQLQAYPWPGNARELKSTVDRLVLLYDGPFLREGWWDPPSSPTERPAVLTANTPHGEARLGVNRKQKLELAKRLLKESENDYTWVCSQLGINTSTLWRWRKAGQI